MTIRGLHTARFARLGLTTVLAILCILAGGAAQATIVVPDYKNDEGTNYRLYDKCKGETPGGTTLLNDGTIADPVLYNATTGSLFLDGLTNQFPPGTAEVGKDKIAGYEFGASLTGTIHVTWYKAFDYEHNYNANGKSGTQCLHGVRFNAYYEPEPGSKDPAVDWLQIRSEVGYKNRKYQVDPPRGRDDNGRVWDQSPFYWESSSSRLAYWYDKSHDLPDTKKVAVFTDVPLTPHEEKDAFHYQETFSLFLADWNSVTKVVTLHECITWGFSAECREEHGQRTPEPPALAAAVMMLACLAVAAFARSRARRHATA